ncbi:MAG: class I SAM-dependent methyltransferase [Hyphomicrobiaceae bacterium]|nr:class I SAM-dependent methyltransferase [Hyphomicrobiaceae bacterium]
MTGFSADWLTLREPVDHRSRNRELTSQLAARFAARDDITVIDIGCGTGSNLRGTAPMLATRQQWTLVDYDPALLLAARHQLAAWAETSFADGETLVLERAGKTIRVGFRQADLAADLDAALGQGADIITAAAFFDLASPAFIRRFADAVAVRRAVFYTVLTYNGIQRWQPRSPADNAMAAAFHRHQMTDKGLGAAAGPTAPQELADAFACQESYSVIEGDSPWVLGSDDQALIAELQAGHAQAVSETRAVDAATIAAWVKLVRTGSTVGHTDTLAVPA